MSVTIAVKNACTTCGEGPYWEESTQSLLYVDMGAGDVHRYHPATGTDSKIHIGGDVTFIVPCRSGGYVIGHNRDVSVLDWQTGEVRAITSVDAGTRHRFNDAKCDANGRLWAGSMIHETLLGEHMGYRARGEQPPADPEYHQGHLYSLDSGASLTRNHLNDLCIPNGLAWSADNKTFFFIDTCYRKLWAFDFDLQAGNISNRREVSPLEPQSELGFPDGMCIDAEDKIWLACLEGGKVVRIDPETGRTLRTVEFPDADLITSCAWGGENYDELYVTSKCRGGDKRQENEGSLFKVTGLGVKGVAPVPFNG